MDFTVDHRLNEFVRAHHLVSTVVAGFANYGVIVFGALAVLVWFVAVPGREDGWKRACTAGLASAAVGLLANQAIGHVWDRPRPYQAHPHAIIPILARSSDPSFPSDHATAAFAIAFGVFFVRRRPGCLFLVFAALISASRVLAGMHYPTDVLAGAVIGLASGYLTARVAMRPILAPIIGLASRISDPVVRAARRTPPVRRVLLDPRVRSMIVLAAGLALLAVFAVDLRQNLLDEMELSLLGLWAAVVVGATKLAATPLAE